MLSKHEYILSGISTPSTGTLAVAGMQFTNVGFFAAPWNGSTNPPTGTITLLGQLAPNMPYVQLFSTGVTTSTGYYTSINGPWYQLQAIASPVTTGVFSVLARFNW